MNTEITTEQDDMLLEVLTELSQPWPYPDVAAETAMTALQPILAAIRRHAAADALKTQAARLGAVNSQYMKRLKHYEYGSDAYNLTVARAGQVTADARKLRDAARDIIAEGWEFTCYATWAATRDDPGYGCDAPVENEGDYCPRHEPEDDENRWADD